MLRRYVVGAIFWACGFNEALFAQVPVKIDFGRDVQPLFKTHCYGCHGPTQQMNGFRLDRRRDAMKGGTLAMIGPGNSSGSRLYHRLIGNEYGTQMPPTGPLSQDQINIIQAWIDQGAVWPDDLSGEKTAPPPDAQATQMMEALRNGDRKAFKKMLHESPKVVNLKGPGGATPLMYATLYGDSDSVRLLLESGADPKIRNEAGATPLMWAVDDLEKTRLLLEHGADANARSEDGRAPLIIAAGQFGSGGVVKLLLDHGANPSLKSPGIFGPTTPLSEAASANDETVLQILIERGADVKGAGYLPLYFALRGNCGRCVDMLIKSADRDVLNMAMLFDAPPLGDARAVKALLDRGADVNAKDPEGHTILMLAASSDALPVECVKALIERGADVNAKTAKAETALEFAKQRGQTAIVDLLIQAGAQAGASAERAIKPKPASSVRTAVERSIPLLQRTDVTFFRKSGCVSCHNNALTALSIAAAKKNGFPINDDIASKQLKIVATYIDSWRERALQGVGIPGDADTVSYIMIGMAAQNYSPDAATDALARYLRNRQSPDGRWLILGHRPPLESSEIEVTAASMRALQVYAPKTQRAHYQEAIQRAARWLMKAQPQTTEERAFRLLGLGWAETKQEIIRKAARELVAEQRSDGGWAQLSSLASDAYATGQALVALKESGALVVTDTAYRRGTQFLLNTQLEDGSWYVKSRAIPIQPYFESDFPHGHDQWISVTATNWATTALAFAAVDKKL